MLNEELKTRLNGAESLEEVKGLLNGEQNLDADRVWEELQGHRSSKSERLDLDELDSVSGGADRDWVKDGCAATCEPRSWCGSNDYCIFWDVTYDNFWAKCPDGHDHVWVNDTCSRCGYTRQHVPGGDPG